MALLALADREVDRLAAADLRARLRVLLNDCARLFIRVLLVDRAELQPHLLELGLGIRLREAREVRHLDLFAALADVDRDEALLLDFGASRRVLRDDLSRRHVGIVGLRHVDAQLLVFEDLARERHLLARDIGDCDFRRAPELAVAHECADEEAGQEDDEQARYEFLRLEDGLLLLGLVLFIALILRRAARRDGLLRGLDARQDLRRIGVLRHRRHLRHRL